jgi:hypothetical protein
MPTADQVRALKLFAKTSEGWERAKGHPRVSQKMLVSLVQLGYLEEKWQGALRWVRITEKGEKAVQDDIWPD